MKTIACLSVALAAAVLPLTAMARPELAAGQKVVYSWNYESDSGYADINECVQDILSAEGKLLSKTVVHDFVSNPGTQNVFCADIAHNQAQTFVVTFDPSWGGFYCHKITYKADGSQDWNYASAFLCGI